MAYIDFRAALLEGPLEGITCLAGTMVQEVFATHPTIRDACRASIIGHAQSLEADLSAAMATHVITFCSARSLGLHTQAVLQGAFILAKAEAGPPVAAESVTHLKGYFRQLLQPQHPKGETP